MFLIPQPCSMLPVFPWQGFWILKEAKARLAWAQHALHTCEQAVAATATQAVCLQFAPGGLQALPAVQGWLQGLGFEFYGLRFQTPGFHQN